MITEQLQIMRISAETEDIPLPSYQTKGASGLDIAAAVTTDTTISQGEIVLVPTGFAVAIPYGYEVQIRPRSGLALNYGITLINSPGTIDADYRGEIQVPLINHGKKAFVIRRGERIAQMVVAQVVQMELKEVTSLGTTVRGLNGFGHTGR